MPLPRPLALATLALAALVALYLVFSPSSTAPLPLHYDHQPTPQQPPFLPSPPTAIHHPKRIAIVGAGASGSSAAFFLSRAARATHGEGAVELVVFERDGRVGGRSTTVKAYGPDGADGEGAADDDEGRGNPVELGASIFVRLMLAPPPLLDPWARCLLLRCPSADIGPSPPHPSPQVDAKCVPPPPSPHPSLPG